MSNAIPGWYDDGTGRQRWWDGSAWQQYAPAPGPAPVLVYPQQQVMLVREPSNGLAVASMVIGITSTVLSWTIILLFFTVPAALVGLILGIVGLGRAKSLNGRGRGMAVTGIVLNGLPFAIALIFAILGIVGAAVGGATDTYSGV